MIKNNITDTIAAIATPIGEGGIGIVRLSGKDALRIADKVFTCKEGKKPSDFKTYTTHYGWITTDSIIIDEVILTTMRAPRSFTREDVVEINCHSGIVALQAVLGLVLENGCRLASPGEFTKRAFINGRIDLAQAEAVLDIIRAKTDSALRIGIEQLKGALSGRINKICASLLEILSSMEACIDFPDEEISSPDIAAVHKKLKKLNDGLKIMLEDSKRARILREGIHAVICGSPNVGKSSLLNALLKRERSIVTPVAGTTRDAIEEVIDIKGIPVRIVDTAGLLEPRDLIERKAVQRTKKHLELADLVILMFDASKNLTKDDEALIKKLKKKLVLAVINKIDLKQKINKNKIVNKFSSIVEVSAKRNKNIGLLEDTIAGLVFQGKVATQESLLVSNARHISSIREAQKLIAQAMDSVDNKLPLEFIALDIKEALLCLEAVLGRNFSEGLLDKIFSDFCIGK
ncbi:MAG: tRNA uridine-5-carboxymethylaminomethyl(34) synthesis GTPase MnmE [Candidatus Omnitrophota bacterium]